MPIPGNAEPGAFSGQQQQVHQQSINFSNAIPIKKRRFPIIRPSSPLPEEKPSGFEHHDSKNKQDSNIPDKGLSLSDAINTDPPGNSDVIKNPVSIIKNEASSTNIDLAQVNVAISATKPQEEKSSVSLVPIDDLGSKTDVLMNEKSSEPEVPEICMGAQTDVKQEIFAGQSEGTCSLELSPSLMNVELSLGPKESRVPDFLHENSEAVCHKSDKSDPSLLSLALSEETHVLNDPSGNTAGSIGNQLCANRSNWDLNTTMDVWEGSTNSDASGHRLVDIAGIIKTNSCHDEQSSLTTTSTAGLSLSKGKSILDYHRSNSSNVYIQPSKQSKTDNSLGLGLPMAYKELDASREHTSLSDNSVSASASPKLILQQVLSNLNRSVKSEPVDENSKRDCSVGSCSSSNVGLLRLSSVKTEFCNNLGQETALQSSISPEKLVNSRSIKSEVVQEDNQEARKSEDTLLSLSARVMQHQESCASSSALPVALMPQNLCPSQLPTRLELTMSGDMSNQSEPSFHSNRLHNHNDIPDEQIASLVAKPASQDDKQSVPCKVGISSVVDTEKCKLTRIDEDTVESCHYGEIAANDEEKINTSAEMLEEDSFGSDCESQENCAVDTSIDIGENICDKEDEEYEDGEVREPLEHPAGDDPTVEGKATENLELVGCDSQCLQPSVLLGDQNINASDEKDLISENHHETPGDTNKDCITVSYEPNRSNSLQKLSEEVLEVGIDENRSISVDPDKLLDLSGRKDVEGSPGKEISGERQTDGSHGVGVGVGVGDQVTDKVVKEICLGENDSTLSKVEASFHDAAKDSNNISNKSRIINLSRASVVTSPCKTRSIPNRLLTSRSGKERCSDPSGEIQPRGSRNEIYAGGLNKFAKDRVHDQSLRNSRPSFMHGRGRPSGRFGSLRNEWNPDHDFGSETSYGPSDYRVIRRKHASELELECDDYHIPQDGTALGSNRRKTLNDEFPSLRRTSLRRVSPGDRDGPVTRGIQMLRRIPRNMSPSRCNIEATSEVIGLRHGDKFMRHLSDDVIDPVYSRPQAMYSELDGQLVRGNRNFSTLQRKGYPRIRSKSPDSSRTRSPGLWSSRRRSPDGPPELTQRRSPALYRMGRMTSPDRACFRDEMVDRRRGSPSYVARHPSDMRDVDSGRDHVHPRPGNSNRRSSPARVFPRNARRADALDSREMGDGDEYMNGPLHANKFHELRGDGNIDDRRKFIDRRGPLRSFRPNYNNDGDNFRFPLNDGPRPFRFCPDADTEFADRNNMREREFDGHIKHQSLVVPRRIRNIEEQQDGNYRPIERVWHDDGFADDRMKRRRF